MTSTVQIGLIALIFLSAAAAIFVSVLISRRRDLPVAARRAFLLSNLALIACLASAIAGISVLPQHELPGSLLVGFAAVCLIVKFVLVRRFAHLIRRGSGANFTAASQAIKKT